MRHIVFVVGNYKNGGVPMRTTNLANQFAKKGYSPTILVTKDIADKIHIGRTTLMTQFKKYTGITPTEFRNKYKSSK